MANTRTIQCNVARLLLLGALISTGAVAQVMPADSAASPQLIDQAVEDADPLATSLRVVEGGLAQPADFRRVYLIPNSDQYMRAQGGLYAVFPRSVYSRANGATAVGIPANTQFFIGQPNAADLGIQKTLTATEMTQEPRSMRRDMRVESSLVDGHALRIESHRERRIDTAMGQVSEGPSRRSVHETRLPRDQRRVPLPPPMTAPDPIQAVRDNEYAVVAGEPLQPIGTDRQARGRQVRSIIRRAAGLDADEAGFKSMGRPTPQRPHGRDEAQADDQAARGPSSLSSK